MQHQHNASKEQVATKDNLTVTWERLIPKQIADDPASQELLDIHLRHYETAKRYVKNKRVLDIACGSGYGSQMLSLAGASMVVGVDISLESVEYARKHYQENNIEFVCSDAQQFECREPFDVVVSFETIEHVPHPDKFLNRLCSLLVPEGDLLLSVPLGETRHIDPYHLHAFSQEDVFTLFEKAGFSIDKYRCDDWKLTRADLLRWRKLYPTARPSLYEQFCTYRGWQLLYDFFIRGIIHVPDLMVAARVKSPTIKVHQNPSHLD